MFTYTIQNYTDKLPSIRPEHVLIHSNINNNSLTREEASKPLHRSGSNTSSINPTPARFKSISDLEIYFSYELT